MLEEYIFNVKCDPSANEVSCFLREKAIPSDISYRYWQEKLYSPQDNGKVASNLVILRDEDFRDFVTLSTEVITRTSIKPDTGTVDPHKLWTEEYLPPESLLYCLALAADPKVKIRELTGELKNYSLDSAKGILKLFYHEIGKNNLAQIGGGETIGCGLVRIRALGK